MSSSLEYIYHQLEHLRGEPIRSFVRKESEWNDFCEYCDNEHFVKRPVVSCCIFTYNQERFIEQCIRSVVSQVTDFEYEVLICEDCSTDGSLAVCLKYQRDYPNKVRIIHANKNYYHGALNFKRGFEFVRGEFVAICEGDDYWCNPNKLQMQVNALRRNPQARICYTDYCTQVDECVSNPIMLTRGFWNVLPNLTQKDFVRGDRIITALKGDFLPTASIMVYRDWLVEFENSDLGMLMLALSDRKWKLSAASVALPMFVRDVCTVYRKNVGVCAAYSRRKSLKLTSDKYRIYFQIAWPWLSSDEIGIDVFNMARSVAGQSSYGVSKSIQIGIFILSLLCVNELSIRQRLEMLVHGLLCLLLVHSFVVRIVVGTGLNKIGRCLR